MTFSITPNAAGAVLQVDGTTRLSVNSDGNVLLSGSDTGANPNALMRRYDIEYLAQYQSKQQGPRVILANNITYYSLWNHIGSSVSSAKRITICLDELKSSSTSQFMLSFQDYTNSNPLGISYSSAANAGGTASTQSVADQVSKRGILLTPTGVVTTIKLSGTIVIERMPADAGSAPMYLITSNLFSGTRNGVVGTAAIYQAVGSYKISSNDPASCITSVNIKTFAETAVLTGNMSVTVEG